VLRTIAEAVGDNHNRRLDIICLGEEIFIRFWNLDPLENGPLNKWYAYNLRQMAQGYFLHNVIEGICPQSVLENESLWYLESGKAIYKIGEIGFGGTKRSARRRKGPIR